MGLWGRKQGMKKYMSNISDFSARKGNEGIDMTKYKGLTLKQYKSTVYSTIIMIMYDL